jgi:tRNA G37 N-methylase Trm5
MFSGVSPFSIVIAKKCRKKINKITSIELGKECCKFAAENVKMNKVFDIVKVIPGDVKKVMPKILKANKMNKFDFVIMARPNLKETFLREGFMACRKKAIIIYYGFCAEKELESMLADIHKEAKEHKKKIKIINVKEAGDIAPYEHRYRIEIRVC